MEQSSFKSSIPEAKIAAVEKALQTAFNTTTIENIELLTGGLSGAIVYKIIVGGKPYALRLIMRIDPLNDQLRCVNSTKLYRFRLARCLEFNSIQSWWGAVATTLVKNSKQKQLRV